MQFAEFEYFYDIIYPRYSIYRLFCKSWIKCISTGYNSYIKYQLDNIVINEHIEQ